jgi:nucleoside diphosphate kinase
VQRGLIAEVISRFEKRGYQLKGAAPRQAESQIWQD